MLSVSFPLQKQSVKVLIVDSESKNRVFLSRVLSSLAVDNIFSLNNYQDFKSQFSFFIPDLVILNMNTPCGFTEMIIEWIRSQAIGRFIPIVVTANNQDERVIKALGKGENSYLKTPFIASQVALQITNLFPRLISKDGLGFERDFLDQQTDISLDTLQIEISQRNEIEQELHFQAHHEYHTRLPNRVFFQKVLAGLLSKISAESSQSKTLVIFHLHQFSEINNTLGHSSADEILVDMALRFAKLTESYVEVLSLQCGIYDKAGKIALLDRTHFTIVLNDVHEYRLEEIISQLLGSSSKPLLYQGMQIETPISVGVAPSCAGDDVAAWLRRAYVALDFAEQEKQLWAGYCQQADRYSKKKLTLVADLRNAIFNDQGLFLQYQPQFSCKKGAISGVEVLLRWNHPTYGALPADEIVALAEQTGLIQPLTRWVIKHAFSQYQKILASRFDLTLSINISTLSLWQEYLMEDIAQQLEIYDIPPNRLILEVTETVLMKKPERSLEFLSGITALGIKVALDDFGTGFSSLAYLKKMPVSELKIDRSFIKELCYSHEDQVIVQSIISMCRGLGVDVVAEGVEDKETQSKLETLGCDRLQGYYLAEPLLGDDLLSRLAEGSS